MSDESQVKSITMDEAIEQYDSKFRYVLLASTRAEQLVRGARAKLELPGKKPSRVAMEEVRCGMVPWDYGPQPEPEIEELDEGEIPAEAAGEGEAGSRSSG